MIPTVRLYRADHVGHIIVNESDAAAWRADGWSDKAPKPRKTRTPRKTKADGDQADDAADAGDESSDEPVSEANDDAAIDRAAQDADQGQAE